MKLFYLLISYFSIISYEFISCYIYFAFSSLSKLISYKLESLEEYLSNTKLFYSIVFYVVSFLI